jgi:hypothetical protein
MNRYHEIFPVPGTVARLDGTPASLLDLSAYPVVAMCETCGGKVRSENYLLAPWVHTEGVSRPHTSAE